MNEIMVTSDNVRHWLDAYKELEKDIGNQVERLERLKLKMESVGAQQITDMPRAPSNDPDRFSILLHRKKELSDEIDLLEAKRDQIKAILLSVICSLRNANEKAVIEMRYLDDCKWTDVNKMIFGRRDDFELRQDSYLRTTANIHRRALEHMAIRFNTMQLPEYNALKEIAPI